MEHGLHADRYAVALMPDASKLLAAWRDSELLKQALCHRSAGAQNNERLEFIGDAVLSLIIGHELLDKFPDAPEGNLTRMRAYLVRGETLASLSRELKLNQMIVLGAGEESSDGRDKDSILAGAFEAVLGAIYCMEGLAVAREWIMRVYANRLDSISAESDLRDAKTELQERMHSRGEDLPVYSVQPVAGKNGSPIFKAHCQAAAYHAEGEGGSIRKAEQNAARKVLAQLSDVK